MSNMKQYYQIQNNKIRRQNYITKARFHRNSWLERKREKKKEEEEENEVQCFFFFMFRPLFDDMHFNNT